MKATTLTVETIDQFLSFISERGHSVRTARAYGTDLKTFLLEAKEVEIDLEEEFELLGMGWLQMNRNILAPKTTLRRKTSLLSFAKWAGMPPGLFGDWKGPKPARVIAHPLPEGIDSIRRMIDQTDNEKHKALVGLCGYAALRVGEAVEIGPAGVNAETMVLTVHGKGGVSRIVPITPELWEVLAIPTSRAFLEKGRPIVGIDERFARRKIKQLGVLAGLTREVASHDLRATCATHMYHKMGKDIVAVSAILGHASVKTTQIYLGLDLESIREGMRP